VDKKCRRPDDSSKQTENLARKLWTKPQPAKGTIDGPLNEGGGEPQNTECQRQPFGKRRPICCSRILMILLGDLKVVGQLFLEKRLTICDRVAARRSFFVIFPVIVNDSSHLPYSSKGLLRWQAVIRTPSTEHHRSYASHDYSKSDLPEVKSVRALT
jgi:hypothetical protein